MLPALIVAWGGQAGFENVFVQYRQAVESVGSNAPGMSVCDVLDPAAIPCEGAEFRASWRGRLPDSKASIRPSGEALTAHW